MLTAFTAGLMSVFTPMGLLAILGVFYVESLSA